MKNEPLKILAFFAGVCAVTLGLVWGMVAIASHYRDDFDTTTRTTQPAPVPVPVERGGVWDQRNFPCQEDEVLGYAPEFGPDRVGCIHIEEVK